MREHQTKYARTMENENCAVKSAFRFPETVKPATATKIAAKRCRSTYNNDVHLLSARTKQEALNENVADLVDGEFLVRFTSLCAMVPL